MSTQPTIDVCIVGAGISGLNALVVATAHLPRSARAVLIDARPRPGGMWVDTYDYVRLHQPHPIFTAGDIPWELDKEPHHLASKTEVLDHLAHCLEVARARIDVDARFGWSYVAHTAHEGVVEVELRAPDGTTQSMLTRRLIKAFGHDVHPKAPLHTSSSRVRSVTPETLDLAAIRRSGTPVWIVGGGKTAMDTAHRIVTAAPSCAVHMLAGPGTIFARRETFFPEGVRRWWTGTPINTMVREVSDRFDGTNEHEVRDWFRSRYGISPLPDAANFFSAYMSEAENRVIS